MSRMFLIPGTGKPMKTWNIFVGCEHKCIYCNARKAALTRFRHLARYKDGFKPHLVESELKKTFKPGEFVFICYMGDISYATPEDFQRILARVHDFPDTFFLIQTKDPGQLFELKVSYNINLPPHVYLGTTIETNRETASFSTAPSPRDRFDFSLVIRTAGNSSLSSR